MNLEQLSQQFPGVLMWKKNHDSVYMDSNTICASLFGLKNPEQMHGLRDEHLPCKLSESAEIFQQEDANVMLRQKSHRFLEIVQCVDDQWKAFIVTKNPLYNAENQLVGTFAFSIDATESLLHFCGSVLTSETTQQATSRQPLKQQSYILDNDYHDLKLSPKQAECLFYLIRGKTAKEIAIMMGHISPRTVEAHIERIKQKLDCHSKKEVIEKAIHQGFLRILPSFILNKNYFICLND